MNEATTDLATYAMLYVVFYGPVIWLGLTAIFANSDDG